jgi:hypothetical protein
MPQCEGNGKENRHSQTIQFEENDSVHQRVLLTYRSDVQWVLSINVLPEDGPMWPKHVANNRMYFNDILRTF